jgi:hypothetical protein
MLGFAVPFSTLKMLRQNHFAEPNWHVLTDPFSIQKGYFGNALVLVCYPTLGVTLDEGPGTNEVKQSYWSKALNFSQGL